MQFKIAFYPRLRVAAIAILVVAGALAAQSHASTAGAQGPPDHAPDHVQDRIPDHVQDLLDRTGRGERVRVIVELPSQADQGPVASQARGQGAAVLREYNNFPMLALNVNENALRGLVQSPRVISINEDVASPPALDSSLPVINADQVQTLGWDGDGITVAILDTGIDSNHDFVSGRVVEEACFSSDGFLGFGDQEPLCPNGDTEQTGGGAASINVSNCQDSGTNMCDHGMHVAGIAGGDGEGLTDPLAPDAGVAPAVNIIAIQVFTRREDDDNCDGNAPCVRTFTSDQIAGLDHVYDLRDDYTIAAANMSLGGGENADTCDGDDRKTPIDTLHGANIATVVAAGNDGLGEEVGAPACVSSAITVGSTTDSDTVSGFSNRGPLLDLFAPGSGIISSVDGGFAGKGGTSMAAPHVTGAWAVMRQAYPTMSVDEILDVFQATGVAISYASGPGDDPADWTNTVTTPRIDLLAALQDQSTPPDLEVDNGEVTVDEGEIATNSGTLENHDEGPVTFSASAGEASNNGDGTWSWTFETSDGPAQSQTVTVTGANNKGVESEVEFDLVVDNVAPTVTIVPDQVTTIDEGESLSIGADYDDPGADDSPFTATITCYDVADGENTVPAGFSLGQVSGTCSYGDTSQAGEPPDGTLTVTVTVTDKDGDSGSDSFELTVKNVDPDATIDTGGATVIGGTPTFIAQVGDTLDFSGDVSDPGSDDLHLTWEWGDGTEDTATYLVNPPDPDPFPSPDLEARSITDEQSHAWASACFYTVTLTAEDDDGGSSPDTVPVIIGGDAGETRGAGYWLHQYRGNGSLDFTEEALETCYLATVEHMSAVFPEAYDGPLSLDDAEDILFVAGNNGTPEELLDQQLLAAWLNFANGAFALDGPVDTDGDGVADTPFSDVVAEAEDVRLDPDATDAALEEQKDILENVNLMHSG